jgi:hypothetical protein
VRLFNLAGISWFRAVLLIHQADHPGYGSVEVNAGNSKGFPMSPLIFRTTAGKLNGQRSQYSNQSTGESEECRHHISSS